ncbi:MAG: AAA family ATPase [Aestuariivita sp.]|nr:AAA family ATPase [Aestuariivita sp.]
MPARSIRSVYFTKLVLENIRSFSGSQELILNDGEGRPAQWTLIVGDNGVGKTTLLQCIARMRPVVNEFSNETSGPTPNSVEPEFASEEDNDVLDAYTRSGPNTVAKLKAELSYGVPLTGNREHCRDTISTELFITRKDGRLADFKRAGTSPPNVEEPLVLAYGAGRHPNTSGLNKAIATGLVESLFKVESALSDAEDLLYRLEFGCLKHDQQAKRRLLSLKRMLVEMLPDVVHHQNIEILGPPVSASTNERKGIWVATDYGKVPLSRLSLGYQTVFAWTLDIAWQLLDRYPDSQDPLKEPAIVIVDEIDLHLHPRWQRAIREHLIKHFPNAQFIVTAHSPLMAQSSLGGNLAVLQKQQDHAEILNDPAIIREWRLDQVITSDLFGLESARPPEVEKLFQRRSVLLEKRHLTTKEQQELEDLDAQAGQLPTAESLAGNDAMAIIHRAAEVLKKTG